MMGIGHVTLLAEVPSTSIEYCEVYQIVRSPWIPGSLVHCFYLPELTKTCPKYKIVYLYLLSSFCL